MRTYAFFAMLLFAQACGDDTDGAGDHTGSVDQAQTISHDINAANCPGGAGGGTPNFKCYCFGRPASSAQSPYACGYLTRAAQGDTRAVFYGIGNSVDNAMLSCTSSRSYYVDAQITGRAVYRDGTCVEAGGDLGTDCSLAP